MKNRLFDARLYYIESLLVDLKNANLNALRTSLRTNNEWSYLRSFAQLARFLQCDPKTAVRLLRLGLIRHSVLGGEISVFIPDILEAAQKDERVGKFITRIRKDASCNSSQIRVSSPPKIMIETGLYPDRFVDAKVKYDGWSTNVCFPYHLWTQPDKVIDYVEQIVRDQHAKRPFRIAPAGC